MLGHSQTSTTNNIYAHAVRFADAAASEALDNILFSKTNNAQKITGYIKNIVNNA